MNLNCFTESIWGNVLHPLNIIECTHISLVLTECSKSAMISIFMSLRTGMLAEWRDQDTNRWMPLCLKFNGASWPFIINGAISIIRWSLSSSVMEWADKSTDSRVYSFWIIVGRFKWSPLAETWIMFTADMYCGFNNSADFTRLIKTARSSSSR